MADFPIFGTLVGVILVLINYYVYKFQPRYSLQTLCLSATFIFGWIASLEPTNSLFVSMFLLSMICSAISMVVMAVDLIAWATQLMVKRQGL